MNASLSTTKLEQWLKSATKRLAAAGIGTARLDCLILLEDSFSRDRSYLLAHPELELSPTQATSLEKQLHRRMQHEPLAYIRGKTEFYGREFLLNRNVLEPRPESETMIELFKELPLSPESYIADVGSGSGALGITAVLEHPGIQADFIDIDPLTLKVARANAKKHKISGAFYEGDLLNAPKTSYEVLLCNLPYVPDSYQINEAAAMEPRVAIFGGVDGLDLYRRLFGQIDTLKYKPTFILSESLPFQHTVLAKLARQHGYEQQQESDFIQLFSLIKV